MHGLQLQTLNESFITESQMLVEAVSQDSESPLAECVFVNMACLAPSLSMLQPLTSSLDDSMLPALSSALQTRLHKSEKWGEDNNDDAQFLTGLFQQYGARLLDMELATMVLQHYGGNVTAAMLQLLCLIIHIQAGSEAVSVDSWQTSDALAPIRRSVLTWLKYIYPGALLNSGLMHGADKPPHQSIANFQAAAEYWTSIHQSLFQQCASEDPQATSLPLREYYSLPSRRIVEWLGMLHMDNITKSAANQVGEKSLLRALTPAANFTECGKVPPSAGASVYHQMQHGQGYSIDRKFDAQGVMRECWRRNYRKEWVERHHHCSLCNDDAAVPPCFETFRAWLQQSCPAWLRRYTHKCLLTPLNLI